VNGPGAPLHYGDPFKEQRLLEAGQASVDVSGFPTFSISGPERLSWLQAITTQDFSALRPGVEVAAYILDPQGHIIHAFTGTDDGECFAARTEPGHLDALLEWLRRMVFATKVEVVAGGCRTAFGDLGPCSAFASQSQDDEIDGRSSPRVPGSCLTQAGMWAWDALRIAKGIPRIFLDTDERTLPNELANPVGDRLGDAVHLKKGCYPGQETVARIYNVGRPPRRLTRLLLDGSEDRLPEIGSDVLLDGQSVGRMGTSARHYELGPIGLALIKRDIPLDATLTVEGIPAAQQVIVDPEVGLHVTGPSELRAGRRRLM
jgi:folate-binding protein YgfZ